MTPTFRLRQAALAALIALASVVAGTTAALAESGESLKSREAASARVTAKPQRMTLLPSKAQSRKAAVAPSAAPPAMRWGRKGSDAWTRELLAALEKDAGGLVRTVPGDVTTYCPGYVTASADERAHFWAGLVSSIAKHESTWNPKAKGGGGKWLGLMQIAPSTWRTYGCSGEILEGGDNLSCAVKIMARQVGRDGVIAGGGSRGVGRDWAPMRSGAKRADIAGWTRQQAYCSL